MTQATPRPGRLARAIETLLKGPNVPDREFLLSAVSYRQLYDMAGQLHGALAQEPGPVCLFAENRAVIASALLAALFSGRPLVLPHATSAQAIAQMHRRLDFRLAVVDGDRPLPPGVAPVCPDPASGGGAGFEGSLPRPDAEWVRLFTGGSTGRPRIWSKTVENLVGESAYLVDTYGFCPEDRIVATVPAFHIYGLLYSLLAPLIAGAGVSAEMPSYPREIAAACDICKATVLVSVPVHYRAMRETGVYCRPLRLAFSSAGPLDAADADAFSGSTGTGVTEIYGSTETGGVAARCRAAGQRALHPFSVVDWKIAAGRLCVRSAFLSPELATDAEGFFQTADRAAVAEEDGFAILGREDGVVKVGGKRIDTEEVREQIRCFPGVRDAFIAALPAQTGRRAALVAIVEGDAAPDALRRHLSGCLEPHAVPRRIRMVEKLPVTAAGKLDRRQVIKLLAG